MAALCSLLPNASSPSGKTYKETFLLLICRHQTCLPQPFNAALSNFISDLFIGWSHCFQFPNIMNFFWAIPRRRWTFTWFFTWPTGAPLFFLDEVLNKLGQAFIINARSTLWNWEHISLGSNYQQSKHVCCDLGASTHNLHTLQVNALRSANPEPRVKIGQSTPNAVSFWETEQNAPPGWFLLMRRKGRGWLLVGIYQKASLVHYFHDRFGGVCLAGGFCSAWPLNNP